MYPEASGLLEVIGGTALTDTCMASKFEVKHGGAAQESRPVIDESAIGKICIDYC